MVGPFEIILTTLMIVVTLGVGWILVLWPTIIILRRAGYSSLWALVWFLPLLNIVAVWIFSFRRWPYEGPPTVR